MYKTVVLPVSCGGKTWSLTIKEEHRFRCLRTGAEENIWPKREEVAGGWRRLHNEVDEMGRACRTHGRDEKYIQNFGRKF
jgi:uncharacterized protein YbdZ (MbtH family)